MPKNRVHRAQIFQSFDALKGFREILKEQEKIVVSKKVLSEYDCEQLNYIIHQVHVGDILKIIYFKDQQYIQYEGIVSKLNFDTRIIQIVKTKINFNDILQIKIIDKS